MWKKIDFNFPLKAYSVTEKKTKYITNKNIQII